MTRRKGPELKCRFARRAAIITPQNNRILAYCLIALSVLFWSGNFVVGRAVHAEVPPLALSFWRWALATLLLLPWAWAPVRAQRGELLKHWRLLCALGVLGGACNNAVTYLALTMTTATNGVLLASSTPIMIIAMSWAMFGKRLQVREWAGVFISLAGVLIIVAHGELQTLLDLRPNAGDLWVLFGMICWAAYTALLARRPASLHPYAFLTAICCTGLLALAPFYVWEIVSGKHISANLTSLAAIGYAAIFPALLGFIFWNRGVAVVGGNAAGVFLNLMPAMGTLLAILFLGEQPRLFQLVGILLILAGVAMTTRQPALAKPG